MTTIREEANKLINDHYEQHEIDGESIDWRQVARLASAYYSKPGNQYTGGNLHVVLDDTNIDDGSIHWTRGYCDKDGDDDGSSLCALLLLLPECHRELVSHAVGGREGIPLDEPAYCTDPEIVRYQKRD